MNHVATKGPLAISGDASRWSFYGGGVFDGCSYDSNIEINHAIQVNLFWNEQFLNIKVNYMWFKVNDQIAIFNFDRLSDTIPTQFMEITGL